MDDDSWDRLVSQLKSGACTPFLGAGACAGVLPSGAELSRKLAAQWRYPFRDKDNLTKVTQFGAMKYGESVHAKEEICKELATDAAPDFTDPREPHALLADFPLRVFLTTNYDDFILQSLKAAGKTPNVALCPWNPGIDFDRELFRSKAGWKPQPETPLVYHLHGRLQDPTSIVVTEDDYLQFIANLAYDRTAEKNVMLPPVILDALTRRSLLFIGYSLQDWNFRILFDGLQRAVPGINRRRHVSVQPAPKVKRSEVQGLQRRMERYYEDWKISIFWGTAAEFCEQLRGRLT
ncbi:SIR2 family NAD-dependent protein deacylase [Herbidospora daliensis]|uniref:SIR2 family NAD-dependent protein deacylase n=1 Tax=Herbidospora daliensis TaxID=295585 RepID=UPI000783E043|nr:SIR2 family protein [Herbidospora daliensis]